MDWQNTDIHFKHMVRPKLTMWQKLLMALIYLFSVAFGSIGAMVG